MTKHTRRSTITSPTGHIRSYTFQSFLALISAGCLLSFVGGYINTVCFVSFFRTARSSSTGSTSRMVIELGKGHFGIALNFFLLIFSFVLGNFISAALVGGSSFRIRRPYGIVLLLESIALIFSYLFEKTTFPISGTNASLHIGEYLVSLGCGLQNGMCTTFSGAVIRTTHVTGILTDIGLILGQTAFHPRTRKHLWKLKVLIPLYGAFCCGGVIGWFVYTLMEVKAILLPCVIVGILGVIHLCYCKIILVYKTQQINKKPIPTIENDGNTNSGFDKQINGINKDCNETSMTEDDSFNLQIVSVQDMQTDTT